MGQWGNSSTSDTAAPATPARETSSRTTQWIREPAPVEWATVPAATRTPPTEEEEMIEVVVLLRRVGATLDRLWTHALSGGTGRDALRFGEASHGVHRALIALDDGLDAAPVDVRWNDTAAL